MKTDTELKLKDAASQMKLAIKHSGDDDIFRSCINSFISTGRSVTFVMQKESKSLDILGEWYEEQMSHLKKCPIMKFFHDNRTHTIHKGVIKPTKKIIPVWDVKVNGIPQPGIKTVMIWKFDNIDKFMPGNSGNVFRLCELYYITLKWLVSKWLEKRKLIIG